MTLLHAMPLSRDVFTPFGQVVEAHPDTRTPMNEGSFERYDHLATVATGNDARISIVRCSRASLPKHEFDLVERHPLGTQAFIPLRPFRFAVVVAPPGEFDRRKLRAFITNGRQGINYLRGTWHMPLIAFETGQEFLVVDRGHEAQTCDFERLDPPATLMADLT